MENSNPRQSTPWDVLEDACTLIQKPSVTPDDHGCQTWIAAKLQSLGFACQSLPFGEVDNLWATHGSGGPVFVFAGHTDVVPAGDETSWTVPPFSATIQGRRLIGRGSADMKGALAAMLSACQRFIKHHPNHPGTVAFLLTSDEEGPGIDGSAKVVEWLKSQSIQMDYCLIGEPSSQTQLGDMIKVGRRGSLSGHLKIFGKQGHVAYPHQADNPTHSALHIIHALTEKHWDNGDDHFPPTSFQITNLHAGVGVSNVIPGVLECEFNFRFSPQFSPEQLQSIVADHLKSLHLPFELNWTLSGRPFFPPQGKLLASVHQAITQITGITAEESTSGGTSDGRFIATTGTELVECGLLNQTIHQVNEQIAVDDLYVLTDIYHLILTQLLQ